MKTHFLLSKYKHFFYRANFTVRNVAFLATDILTWWKRVTYRRALQRLEHLNDHALRDVGLWREPESRVDEWWRMNPPP